jgi:GT2 family glycosyltransferase
MARLSGSDAQFLRHLEGLAERQCITSKYIENYKSSHPLLSIIIPVFNSKVRFLKDLFDSLHHSSVGDLCEIIVVDDGSQEFSTLLYLRRMAQSTAVRLIQLKENNGPSEAQNAGLRVAKGKYFAIIDHDDRLSRYGLEMVLRTLMRQLNCKLLYTDEVVINERGKPIALFLKPAWDAVMLSGVNYVNHLTVFDTKIGQQLGGYRKAFDGSHDYEFLLRYSRCITEDEIFHLPYPAYQWRTHIRSLSQSQKVTAVFRAREALNQHYSLSGTQVVQANLPDLHRPNFPVTGDSLITVIIPIRDRADLTAKVLNGLLQLTGYKNIEVVVIDNGSVEVETKNLLARLSTQDKRLRVIRDDGDFNFSRLINLGSGHAQGQYLLLLNNDIEIQEPHWLNEMLQCFQYSDVGIVGAKLLYPNRLIQHAGVIVGFGGLAGHWYEGEPSDFPGPMGRLAVRQSVSAVTGACMLVSAECFHALGGMNERDFAIAYNDVDFCLRARQQGYKIIWTPFAELIHHESETRGSDQTPQNIARFQREQENLRRAHQTDEYLDATINPWFTRDRSYPQPAFYDRLMAVRTNGYTSKKIAKS